MSHPSRRGDRPSPPARRLRVPDISPGAIFGPRPGSPEAEAERQFYMRLWNPSRGWAGWTDGHTYEAGDWRLASGDGAAVPPEQWPAWTDEVRFAADPPPLHLLPTTRIHPAEGPLLPLADPEGGAE